MQKDVVDLSKHYIYEMDALVSLHRAECFVLEKKKKNTQKQLFGSSKIVSLRTKPPFPWDSNVQNKFCVARFMHALRT